MELLFIFVAYSSLFISLFPIFICFFLNWNFSIYFNHFCCIWASILYQTIFTVTDAIFEISFDAPFIYTKLIRTPFWSLHTLYDIICNSPSLTVEFYFLLMWKCTDYICVYNKWFLLVLIYVSPWLSEPDLYI